jgi:hypothetical protein
LFWNHRASVYFNIGWPWERFVATFASQRQHSRETVEKDLIDRGRLAAAYARDPRLTGFMAIQPSSTAPVGFLLDINWWLERSGVTIGLDV